MAIYYSPGRIGGQVDLREKPPGVVTIYGEESHSIFGIKSEVADIDGNGTNDLIVGAFYADGPGREDAGKLYFFTSELLVEIRATTGVLDLAEPWPPGVGVVIGPDASTRLGVWMAAGDVNGDGVVDVVVGADQASGFGADAPSFEAGRVYVLYGPLAPGEAIDLRNTTEGMNLVATGLNLQKGDEVLTTNHEHGGGMVCWQYLAKHHGVKMRYIQMPNPVKNKADILVRIERHINKRTRVCSFSHIDTITGLQMPLAEIAEMTRPKGIIFVCDGAQAPGMLDVDVKALGVDAYASSSHKWMLAPKGTGLLYIRKEVQDRVHPIMLYSGYGVYSGSSGTRNVPQILGHGIAMDFHNAIGRPRIEARCRHLSRLVRDRLRDIPALTLLTPEHEELSSGVVTFALDPARGDRSEIVKRFWIEHNMVLKPAQGTYAYVPEEHVKGPHAHYNPIRISTHIFNSEDEVVKMAGLMKKMLA